jgi:hypothetical protein
MNKIDIDLVLKTVLGYERDDSQKGFPVYIKPDGYFIPCSEVDINDIRWALTLVESEWGVDNIKIFYLIRIDGKYQCFISTGSGSSEKVYVVSNKKKPETAISEAVLRVVKINE